MNYKISFERAVNGSRNEVDNLLHAPHVATLAQGSITATKLSSFGQGDHKAVNL